MNRGFMALIAVVLLAISTLAFSLATMSAAASYSDVAYRRELRIQAQLNAQACLDSVSLMAAKDYFLNGPVHLFAFGCNAVVTNDFNGNVSIEVRTTLGGVGAEEIESIKI